MQPPAILTPRRLFRVTASEVTQPNLGYCYNIGYNYVYNVRDRQAV